MQNVFHTFQKSCFGNFILFKTMCSENYVINSKKCIMEKFIEQIISKSHKKKGKIVMKIVGM